MLATFLRGARRSAPLGAALAAAACLDTTGSTAPQFAPTHHAVVYGTVRNAAGEPVAGAVVTPEIAQVCPCYAVNVYVRDGTQPTPASGQYRILYEAALPSRILGQMGVQLEVQPPSGSGLSTAFAAAPFPLPLSQPLDSARVDIVVR